MNPNKKGPQANADQSENEHQTYCNPTWARPSIEKVEKHSVKFCIEHVFHGIEDASLEDGVIICDCPGCDDGVIEIAPTTNGRGIKTTASCPCDLNDFRAAWDFDHMGEWYLDATAIFWHPEELLDLYLDPSRALHTYPPAFQMGYLFHTLHKHDHGDADETGFSAPCHECQGNMRYSLQPDRVVATCPSGCNMKFWMRALGMEFCPADENYMGDRIEPNADRLPSNSPLDMARHVLATGYPDGTIHFWRGQWYVYDAGVYRAMDETTLNASLYPILEKASFQRTKANGDVVTVPIVPDINLNRKVLDAMKSLPGVLLPLCADAHSWINAGDYPPEDLLVMRHSILHLPTRQTFPHTPDLFALTMMDFDFDPDADAEELVRFLESSLPGDKGITDSLLLAEFAGWLLTPRCDHQKMLWLLGKKGSGKSTIAHVFAHLVGARNVTHPQLSEFGERFALQPWEDKRLAIFADAEDVRLDAGKVRERLKKITGNDPVQIDRKGIAAIDTRLHVKIILTANDPPNLSDGAGALARRIMCIDFPVSFTGHEDHGLEDRLVQNLPGILNWALGGLDRLREQGRFTNNVSDGKADFEMMTNPLGAFVEDCCDLGPKKTVLTHVLFAAWRSWCADKGIDHPFHEARMGAKLRALVPGLNKRRLNADGSGHRPNVYEGIGLKMS